MAHLVASITLNSARSNVMQSVFLTQRMVSSIPIVFNWSDSIRPEGFPSSVLLWLVIIVAVVGVGVMVVVVVESNLAQLVGTKLTYFLESSHICLEIIPLHSQMVKFVFHLLDLSSGTILRYQKLLEFNPDNLSSVTVATGKHWIQFASNHAISPTALRPLKLIARVETLSAISFLDWQPEVMADASVVTSFGRHLST
ncbi:hypothetical protein Tco_1227411 [Tanacetum coccineum]